MEQFAQYFVEHIILDFEGDLNLEKITEMVGNSPEGAKLLTKLKTDDDVDDFLFALLEGLRDYITEGITPEIVENEFKEYSEA